MDEQQIVSVLAFHCAKSKNFEGSRPQQTVMSVKNRVPSEERGSFLQGLVQSVIVLPLRVTI
ncbi:MAG: hypothetical protein IAE79_28500 [Anaerolinea sp.]|nr:hypothetical protein [Anaerolinea sp.]